VKRFLFIASVLALIITACQGNPVPTIDAVQVQGSAVAVASTMFALTQAAIPPTDVPTDTPMPSPIPLPTDTPVPQPLVETDTPAVVQSPVANTGTGSCNGPLTSKPVAAPDAGKIGSNVKIVNATKASVTISLYLNLNKLGECGFKSYVIPHSMSITIANDLPYGCYNLSAYVNDPKKPSQPTGNQVCITGPDKTTITVSADSIKVTGP